MRVLLLLVVLLALTSLSSQRKLRADTVTYDWTSAKQKAANFVALLTQDEKVNLTTGIGWEGGPCVGNTWPIARLNFTGLCLDDSPTGVRFAHNVSGFPSALNLAFTWNRDLVYETNQAHGYEYVNKGVHIGLTPMMNMGRVACGGRNWEGFGADPFLAGELAAEAILGLQSQGVVATAKHYIGNEQEHFRTLESSNIDDRTIHEIYGYPFMRSVLAGVGAFMCSYNQINGTYACENDRTINQILKGEWGFQGFVMSDWSATMSTLPSINAGLDQTMPGDITFLSGDSYFGQNLTAALNSGRVSQDRLNDMATRILTPYFLLGQDNGYPSIDFDFRNESILGTRNVESDHADVIRTVGVESAVLLKNKNNILPLPSTVGVSFALIGSDAGPNPEGVNSCSDKGCNIGHLAIGWGSGTVLFPYLITPWDAFTERATLNSQNVIVSLNDTDLNTAQEVASSATYALVFVTADSGEGYITVEGNEGDRNDLVLWHGGDDLVEAVAGVNKNTIVVINSVGPVLLPWINHPNVSAVVFAGLMGQESGNALVEVLFGDQSPSGKLVFTIAKQQSDYSAQVIYTSNAPILQIPYKEALLVDYKWFDSQNITPVFEFGFGLSYTTFAYSNLQITNTSISSRYSTISNETTFYWISADIQNTGSVEGAEIAQLYLGFPAGSGEPPKLLRGFEKVLLSIGETTTVTFEVTNLELGVWDVRLQTWSIPEGNFTVYVGASSRDIRLQANITPIPIPPPSPSNESSNISLNVLLLASLFLALLLL